MMGWIKHSGNSVCFRQGFRQAVAAWVLIGTLMTPQPAIGQSEMEKKWVARVVSIQGEVQIRRKENQQWETVNLEERFLAGDVIKVGVNSRAAFVLKNESTLRVDQRTTLVFSAAEKDQPFLIDLITGAIHFFSRVHRRLHVVTPFVNGTVEGTEFYVRVDANQTAISLFEGRLRVFNPKGSINLVKNQSVAAVANQPPVQMAMVHPRDAVHWTLYYPSVIDFKPDDFECNDDWCKAARQSVNAWRKGNLLEAFNAVDDIPDTISDPRFLLYRAALRLSVGRVDAAAIDLQRARLSESEQGDALALMAVTAVVQNKKEKARQLINQAIANSPVGSTVDMANSYVQQTFFNLDAALASVITATEKDPRNALAWARLSELYLSMGERTHALSAAKRAADIQPDLSHTMAVLGFASLAQMKTEKAKQAFAKAITFDSAAPMARLGLGLAKIRDGQLAKGRGEIEIAACLDPGNALIRSYLGKAYFEEKRDDPAQVQLSAAKQLDPADPTPWYYDALRKQTLNRPVEALHDLQTSFELNDNRAIYRSRLLLDEDLAARSAGIGRIYRDLGFQQLALVQGWKSVNTDPTNYSAHRFLADSYSALPRHEIARVSELLQSQLLQPLNITPVQPSLAETNRFILDGTEPSAPAFNEFSPLFLRNRLALQASGVVGNHSTWGDEIVQSGVWDQFSYSLGQFHHETDGFRENNDRTSNLYNAFAQINLNPSASLLAEYRSSDAEKGDLALRFDPENFDTFYRQDTDRQSFRVGGRYSPNPHNDILGTVIFSELEGKDQSYIPDFDLSYSLEEEQKGVMVEIQHLFRSEMFNLISGIGYFHAESDHFDTYSGFPADAYNTRVDHTNPYIYSQINIPNNVTWSLGASMDFYDSQDTDRDQFNPKMGITWSLTPATTLRAAAFRTLKRNLIADQTLEPTQVAGFNQFYDDGNLTEAWRYGAAIDQALARSLFAGLEYSIRDLEISYQDFTAQDQRVGWDENAGRAYLFWTPHDWVSASLEYGYSRFERDRNFVGPDSFTTLETHKFPIGANFFHPTGAFLRLKATYVDQNGEFGNPRFEPTKDDSDQFWVVDAAVGYRLPKRYGIISLETKNLFDEGFRFQDTDPSNPEIVPERSILLKITLVF
ncbi:MAG: TonB-dependent receptor [Desulfosarcina sp.]|nr:TonB-dependent receptor [Desulfosarcina sp.]MBC2742511.1 TonB-dependent receptor [Desulfosarcina sp.]MBC2765421.1 TonB-dependent receptor [Desulfosarcina sp.]